MMSTVKRMMSQPGVKTIFTHSFVFTHSFSYRILFYIVIYYNHTACTSVCHLFLLYTLYIHNLLQTHSHFEPSRGKQKITQFMYTNKKIRL